jgi:hypothetical protein
MFAPQWQIEQHVEHRELSSPLVIVLSCFAICGETGKIKVSALV